MVKLAATFIFMYVKVPLNYYIMLILVTDKFVNLIDEWQILIYTKELEMLLYVLYLKRPFGISCKWNSGMWSLQQL